MSSKLEDFLKNPVIITKEDYDHLTPFEQNAADVLVELGYQKIAEVSR